MAFFCLVTAGCSNITDQQTSETNHDQVAILKQIRKVNEDGSYTYGYEAGDGSFKVITRNHLINVTSTAPIGFFLRITSSREFPEHKLLIIRVNCF